MKLMKTQGASDAMQVAHYKLTIIIIIIINLLTDSTQITQFVMLVADVEATKYSG